MSLNEIDNKKNYMPRIFSIKRIFGSCLCIAVLSVFACTKEINPRSISGGGGGRVSWFNLSEDVLAQLKVTYNTIYVLIDSSDTAIGKKGPAYLSPIPYFNASSSFLTQYPTDQFNNSLGQPWARYVPLAAGAHTLILIDSGQHPIDTTKLTVSPTDSLSIFYSDSLGVYKTFVFRDTLIPQPTNTGLRVIDLSPDAGKVVFTIDRMQPSGFPDTLQYGTVSSFVSRGASPAGDTLKVRFYDPTDMTTELARSTVYTRPGHGYTIVLTGYARSESYMNSYRGKQVFMSADLRVTVYQNY